MPVMGIAVWGWVGVMVVCCRTDICAGVIDGTGVGSAVSTGVVTGAVVTAAVGAGVAGGRGTLVFGDRKAG